MSKSRDLADILSGNIGPRNVKTDGQKLDTVETNAKDDQTKADIDALNIDADTLDGNDSSYFTGYTDTQIAAIPEASFANLTGKPTTLSGYGITDSLEPADATILKDADIGVNVLAYDANVVSDASYVATDENFTTADHSKLDGIEAGATADQTKADIDALNVDADTLDGQHGSYYTTYADTAVSNLVDSSPAALNTLNELAAALGDDSNFSTTMTNALAGKVDDSQVLTNVPSGALFTDTNTTYSVGDGGLTEHNFTTADHNKLNGIAASANNYSHPTGAGNNHIPSGGSSGQVLTYASSGTATWATPSSPDPFPSAPTWTSPDASYTSNGSWTKPGSVGNDDWVIFHLISGGGSGNAGGYGQGGKGGALVLAVKGASITSSVSFVIGAGGGYNGYGGFANAGLSSSITIAGKTFSSGFGGGASYYDTSGGHGDGVLAWPGGSSPATIITVDDVRGGGSLGGGTSNAGNAGSGGYYGAGGNGALRIHY